MFNPDDDGNGEVEGCRKSTCLVVWITPAVPIENKYNCAGEVEYKNEGEEQSIFRACISKPS